MKLPVALLAVSLAANVALAVAFIARPSLAPPALRDLLGGRSGAAEAAAAANERQAARADQSARAGASRADAAQGRLWASLDTDDLPALVARLRAAGFPTAAIRAIVSAKIQERFSARMNALAQSFEETPYWRPSPTNMMSNPKLIEERQQIYRERTRLMREVLGVEGLVTFGDATAAQRRQYGDLSKPKIDLIERINEDYADMMSMVRAATQGVTLPEDREKLALLEREKRADLAAVLTPQELADYEMRTSNITARLRTAMTFMNATEAEFRTLYQLHEPFADILFTRSLTPGPTPIPFEQRRDANAKLEAQVRAALGDARAAEFQRASNYEFQQLARLGQAENLPMDSIVKAYELRASTSVASARIGDDRSMTVEQKRAALQTLAQNTRTQLVATLGPTIGQNYAQSSQWLRAIENGTVVVFDGTTTMFRPVSSPPPPPPRN